MSNHHKEHPDYSAMGAFAGYGECEDLVQSKTEALDERGDHPVKERKPTFDPSYIRDLSEKVYRLRLEQDCPGNVSRMIEKDEDGGEMLRNRAGFFDGLTRAYLKVLGIEP